MLWLLRSPIVKQGLFSLMTKFFGQENGSADGLYKDKISSDLVLIAKFQWGLC